MKEKLFVPGSGLWTPELPYDGFSVSLLGLGDPKCWKLCKTDESLQFRASSAIFCRQEVFYS
ncbi:MAG: hypothetical protein ABSG51_05980 [Terracidiphilus sp.]|jgi:hypothetical protein